MGKCLLNVVWYFVPIHIFQFFFFSLILIVFDSFAEVSTRAPMNWFFYCELYKNAKGNYSVATSNVFISRIQKITCKKKHNWTDVIAWWLNVEVEWGEKNTKMNLKKKTNKQKPTWPVTEQMIIIIFYFEVAAASTDQISILFFLRFGLFVHER